MTSLTRGIVTKPHLQKGSRAVVMRDRAVEIERFGAKGIQTIREICSGGSPGQHGTLSYDAVLCA